MPWDQTRPVPWKRLFTFEAVYLGLFTTFVVLFQRDKIGSALAAMAFAALVTTVALYALIKFGYQPSWLKSRQEMAAIRSEKIAARQAMKARKAGKPAPAQDRYRPAPTKRTSTGPSNRPRRPNKTRKR
jgi:hypothetical protein